jgi:hypothetical protein
MRTDCPELRRTTEQASAVLQGTVGQDELEAWLPQAFGELAPHLHGHGLASNGYPFARPHQGGHL